MYLYYENYKYNIKGNFLPGDFILYEKKLPNKSIVLQRDYLFITLKYLGNSKFDYISKESKLKYFKVINKSYEIKYKKNNLYKFRVVDVIDNKIFVLYDSLVGSLNEYDIHVKRLVCESNLIDDYDYEKEFKIKNIKIDYSNYKKIDDEFILTIDTKNAKDLDDAIGFKETLTSYILSIHIADVSSYVKENTYIDNDAFKKSFSIYTINKTYPMLPKEISNNLCSLLKNKDSLCLTINFVIDKNTFQIKKYAIYNSIINVKENLTFDDIDLYIKDKISISTNTDFVIDKLYLISNKIQEIYNNKFLFYRGENEYFISNNETFIKNRDNSLGSIMIENFMILANNYVAKFIKKHKVNIPFRFHDIPSISKIENANYYLNLINSNYNIEVNNIQEVAKKIYNDDKLSFLEKICYSNIFIHLQQKAKYHLTNSSHFALGLDYYCHFTAPIRRYSDILVHRQIKHILYKNKKVSNELLNNCIKYINIREDKILKLDRKLEKLYQIMYFKNKEKDCYNAIIYDLTQNGFNIILSNNIEGFIPISSFNEYLIYNEDKKIFYTSKQKKFKIGDIIKVRLYNTDLEKLHLDFKVI